jgi:hypothetical protein
MTGPNNLVELIEGPTAYPATWVGGLVEKMSFFSNGPRINSDYLNPIK